MSDLVDEYESVKRIEYEGEVYVSIKDLSDALTRLCSKAWDANLCTAAVVMAEVRQVIGDAMSRHE